MKESLEKESLKRMVDVTPTRIQTFRITKRDGTLISVVACDD